MIAKLRLTSLFGLVLMACPAAASAGDAGQDPADAGAMRAQVRADWEMQEKRLGRSAQSPEAIRAALRRAGLLLEDLPRVGGVPDLSADAARLAASSSRSMPSASVSPCM